MPGIEPSFWKLCLKCSAIAGVNTYNEALLARRFITVFCLDINNAFAEAHNTVAVLDVFFLIECKFKSERSIETKLIIFVEVNLTV